jgi:hypothetical protein
MASSPVTPQLEQLGDRRFSFYPPIVGIEHNEWTFGEANWSEILLRNVKSNEEVWIPRAYVGDVSKVDEPVMIVGLKRELEYRGGLLSPYARRVLTMPGNPVASAPRAVTEEPRVESGLSVKAVLRSDGGAEGRVGKMIAIALAAGLVLTVIGIAILSLRSTGGTIEYKGVMQIDLGLTAQSDYFDVVRVLGPPAEDHWRDETGERQYRALSYPKNDLIIILMGPDRQKATYIGSKDSKWRTVHAVTLAGGNVSTEAILRTLPRF